MAGPIHISCLSSSLRPANNGRFRSGRFRARISESSRSRQIPALEETDCGYSRDLDNKRLYPAAMIERKVSSWLVRAFAVAVVSLALILFVTGFRPSWLFVDWVGTDHLPFKVSSKIEIASRWYPLKRASMSLLCTPDGLRLMTKARLPYTADERADINASPRPYSYFSHAQVTFDWERSQGRLVTINSFTAKTSIIDFGEVDTIVTAPLLEKDKDAIASWLQRGAPQDASIGVSDFGVDSLRARAGASDVLRFVEKCNAAPRPDNVT